VAKHVVFSAQIHKFDERIYGDGIPYSEPIYVELYELIYLKISCINRY
jgi:hypothetical protein